MKKENNDLRQKLEDMAEGHRRETRDLKTENYTLQKKTTSLEQVLDYCQKL